MVYKNYNADKSKGAVNPYNFVRLGNGVERSAVKKGENTGVIRCRLKTATPLLIPDIPNASTDSNEHKTAPFFKVDGVPVIPGSELKGVIRSAYETLSNSCLSVNNNNVLSARSADIRQPGVIRFESDNSWHLYEAASVKLKKNLAEDCSESADTVKRTWKNTMGKFDNSFKITTGFAEVDAINVNEAVEDYKLDCEIYKKNNEKMNAAKYFPPLAKDGRIFPVFYLEYSVDVQKMVYLSPAQISRSVFRKKVDDMLKTYKHCTDIENVCEACALFGMIAEKKRSDSPVSALASRLRFGDAFPSGKTEFMENVTLKELSGPKISAVEFYSTTPNMHERWTYDTPGTELNGRKFYFHHDNNDFRDDKPTKRNLTAELVGKGAEFSFDIYFERITDSELHKLIWVLAIGENDTEGKQMHKLGHGKPIGLGSVKITVDSVITRSFDPESLSYKEEEKDTAPYFAEIPFDTDSDYFKDYMCITDFTYLDGMKAAYPFGDDMKGKETSKGALTWFKANHNDGQMVRSGRICDIRYHLPKITDKDRLVIPALIASGERNYGTPNNGTPKGNDRKKGGGYSGPTSFEGNRKAPETTSISCPKCRSKLTRPYHKLPMLQSTVCEKCGASFKAKF